MRVAQSAGSVSLALLVGIQDSTKADIGRMSFCGKEKSLSLCRAICQSEQLSE